MDWWWMDGFPWKEWEAEIFHCAWSDSRWRHNPWNKPSQSSIGFSKWQIKEKNMSNFVLFPIFNAEPVSYLYTSKYYTLAEENVTYLPANTHLTVTFDRGWTGWPWVEIIKIFKKYISTCISKASETLKWEGKKHMESFFFFSTSVGRLMNCDTFMNLLGKIHESLQVHT